MLKKLFVLLLTFVMVISLVSCGDINKDKDDSNDKRDVVDTNKDNGKDTDVDVSVDTLDYQEIYKHANELVKEDGSSVLHPIDIFKPNGNIHYNGEDTISVDETVEEDGFTLHFTGVTQKEKDDGTTSVEISLTVTNNTDSSKRLYTSVDAAFEGHAAQLYFTYKSSGATFEVNAGETIETTMVLSGVNTDVLSDYDTISGIVSVYNDFGTNKLISFELHIKDGAEEVYPYKNLGYEVYNQNGVKIDILGYNLIDGGDIFSDGFYVFYGVENNSDKIFVVEPHYILVDGIQNPPFRIPTTKVIPHSYTVSYIVFYSDGLHIESNGIPKEIVFTRLGFYLNDEEYNNDLHYIDDFALKIGRDVIG